MTVPTWAIWVAELAVRAVPPLLRTIRARRAATAAEGRKPVTVALLVHADPSMVARYRSALGIPVYTTGSLGPASSSYDDRAGLARQPLSDVVRRFCPGVAEGTPVVLIGFSAGCWAVRHWLRDIDTRSRVPAAVLLDGLHVTGPSPLGGEVDACREAMAGQRCVVVTHTQIDPVTYRGTADSADRLLAELRLVRMGRRESIDVGDLHVLAYDGTTAGDHGRQLQLVGPDVCRDIVRPYLVDCEIVDSERHPDTDPAPAPELHGIDVSHHNAPDWQRVAQGSAFAYVRATYGTMRDRLVGAHVEAARQRGLTVGLYHFFRPSQDATEQAEAFLAVADSVGICGGDLVHALDVEADPVPTHQPVAPSWEPAVRRVADALTNDAGSPCVIYTTQREARMLGADWLPDHPLWIAHWIGPREPAVPPGTTWAIHQYRVGLYAPWAAHPKDGPSTPGALDHNRARQPLPLIRSASPAPPVRPPRQVTVIPWIYSTHESRSAAREDYLRRLDEEHED